MTETNDVPHEPRFRFDDTDLETLISEWRALGREGLASAKEFIREHPEESVAVAFLAGTFLGAFLGRR
jgi:ElaB/YqjD/DUF883 family membrane-anchored ribosome-binding protein